MAPKGNDDRDPLPGSRRDDAVELYIRLKDIKETGRNYQLELTQSERKSLLQSRQLGARIQKKLEQDGAGTQAISITWKELKELHFETSRGAGQFTGAHKKNCIAIFARLLDLIRDEIARIDKSSAAKRAPRPAKTDTVYQFLIELLGPEPIIWRRIQVQDGTLNELHGHIQAAMGWTDSHLHEFQIKNESYGDPNMLNRGFLDFDGVDSTKINISQIIPRSSKPFRFSYMYDFGDSWDHGIVLEKTLPVNPEMQYPCCLEGQRACPPEDCGGVWGYADFLEALSDPESDEYESLEECYGSGFNPEHFDAEQATKAMQKRLKGNRSRKK